MSDPFTDTELEAYLDEDLPSQEMARIELALRDQRELVQRLIQINRRRDSGVHSLGEIWRRHRISCPSREKLGSYLLQAIDPPEIAYIDFHLREIGCRICQANLEDLKSQREKSADDTVKQRRGRYFQSSAGLLLRRDD